LCLALRFNLEVAEPRDTRLYVNAVDIRVHATNGASRAMRESEKTYSRRSFTAATRQFSFAKAAPHVR
jgi:hypothetical protein